MQQVEVKINFLNQKRKPKLLDIELTAMDLTSEYMSIDSELQLFRILLLYYPLKLNEVFITVVSEVYFITEKNFIRN